MEEIVIAGPHNGVPYFYSVTRFDRHFLNGSVFDVLKNSIIDGFYTDPGQTAITPILPSTLAREELPLTDNIYVVPNPYERGRVRWDEIGGAHVEFRNLPESATIRIFTVAGDLVRVIEHGRGRYGESTGSRAWDLRNTQGEEVTSGVYVYQVETPSGEVIQGHFTVVL